MMMKSLFFLAATAIAGVFADEEVNKVEAGCKPCAKPCPERCADATALEAARLLLNNLCGAVDTDNLALVQGGIATKCATYQAISNVDGTCVDSGSLNFISSITPLVGPASCPLPPTINNSYVDAKGRVIVFANLTWVINAVDVNVEIRAVFEPVEGTCGFRLVDYYSRDVTCIATP